jgi:hypothetical protein
MAAFRSASGRLEPQTRSLALLGSHPPLPELTGVGIAFASLEDNFPPPIPTFPQYCSAPMLSSGAALIPPPIPTFPHQGGRGTRPPWPIECRTLLTLPPPRGKGHLPPPASGGRGGMELSSGRRIRASSSAIDVFGVCTTDRRRRCTSRCRGIGDHTKQRVLDHSPYMIKPAD